MRRPLIRVSDDQTDTIFWGNRHLHHSFDYLFQLCFEGRLKCVDKGLKIVMSKMQRVTGSDFEDEIGALFSGQGLTVRTKLKKIGNKRIVDQNHNDLGDIDVLVAVRMHRQLLVIECKSLSSARTPREVQSDLDEIFTGESSTVVKHLKRCDWISRNFQVVANWLHLEGGEWEICPAIVFNQEMLSAFIADSQIKVIFADELKDVHIDSLLPISSELTYRVTC